jgi:tetratricopeptide (TPR) repeat protein
MACFQQVLEANPAAAAAAQELQRTRETVRDAYLAAAAVERQIAERVVKGVATARRLKVDIAALKADPATAQASRVDELEFSLRLTLSRLPPNGAEGAVERWENAIADYRIALGFTPDDPAVTKELGRVNQTLEDYRRELISNYSADAEAVTVSNDEEEDAKVRLLQLAIGHLARLPPETPASGTEASDAALKRRLARAYEERGRMYRSLAALRRVEFLDRAVAYLEKAAQDFNLARRTDPSLESARTAHEEVAKETLEWRLELSKRIAATYQAEAAAETNETVAIDEAALREMTLQKRDPDVLRALGYESHEMPQPLNNW